MTNYEVTLLLIVNPSRDINLSTPELKRTELIVCANSENEAKTIAKNMEAKLSGLSVWESWANEL
jgi:hypothetical protein